MNKRMNNVEYRKKTIITELIKRKEIQEDFD